MIKKVEDSFIAAITLSLHGTYKNLCKKDYFLYKKAPRCQPDQSSFYEENFQEAFFWATDFQKEQCLLQDTKDHSSKIMSFVRSKF